MSTEQLSEGNDFVCKIKSRLANSGRTVEAFKVNGNTGAVSLKGNLLAPKVPGGATITVGALISDARIVTIQLKDVAGDNLLAATPCTVWISDTAGAAPGSATGLTTAISTGIQLVQDTAQLVIQAVSNSAGVLGVTLTDAAGTQTRYVNVAVGGIVVTSGAVITT